MKIAYIAAGAGGMYCGSCIHDNTLAAALQNHGHDVALIPVYTPLRTDETSVAIDRVFYGAINIYLQQKVPVLGHLPRFLRGWLDNPALLRAVTKSVVSTDARQLGELTLSMLRGEDGRQREELITLVDWLESDFRPEVIQLTNSMLLGLVPRLRKEIPEAKLVCALQGEDIFLDELVEPHRSQVTELLRERAADVDVFTATSTYYADHMSEFLQVSRDRIRAVRLGLNLDGHAMPPSEPSTPLVIGYLARFCPEKGFHVLAQAFRLLSERLGPGAVRLRAAGYLGERDRQYYENVRRQMTTWGLDEHVDLLGEVDRHDKIEFLHSLHVFSVPTTYREPKGLPALEAMANGVPVVLPNHGAFPEIVEGTGGGLLVEPDNAEALADGLQSLLEDPDRRRRLGRQGHDAVHSQYNLDVMVGETMDVYGGPSRVSRSRGLEVSRPERSPSSG